VPHGRDCRPPATFGLTNARVEVVNNKIKLIVKMAYGFRNIDNLFSVVMLKCSDLQVALPGRTA
jgi:transposase